MEFRNFTVDEQLAECASSLVVLETFKALENVKQTTDYLNTKPGLVHETRSTLRQQKSLVDLWRCGFDSQYLRWHLSLPPPSRRRGRAFGCHLEVSGREPKMRAKNSAAKILNTIAKDMGHKFRIRLLAFKGIFFSGNE